MKVNRKFRKLYKRPQSESDLTYSVGLDGINHIVELVYWTEDGSLRMSMGATEAIALASDLLKIGKRALESGYPNEC